MIDFELDQLRLNPDWQLVLAAYYAEHVAMKASQADYDGWLPRMAAVEGVKEEHLPRIHGKLIALGYLKFELAARTCGVKYQLSSAGMRAVNQELPSDDDADSVELAESA